MSGDEVEVRTDAMGSEDVILTAVEAITRIAAIYSRAGWRTDLMA
jgi:hypothetical protein